MVEKTNSKQFGDRQTNRQTHPQTDKVRYTDADGIWPSASKKRNRMLCNEKVQAKKENKFIFLQSLTKVDGFSKGHARGINQVVFFPLFFRILSYF